MPQIQVTNTLTGKKEPLVPLEEGVLRMYVCGLTVYDLPHIGHARTYVAYDIIRRWLEHRGFRVQHVQNVTDVDDKIIARARENGEDPLELARRMTEEADRDFTPLNLLQPERYPKVSDHIPEIIDMTQTLIDRGHAYVGKDAGTAEPSVQPIGAASGTEGNSVYFDVKSDPDYGKLSHLKLEEMLEGVRKEVTSGKRNAADFALWKAAKPGEVSWDSPWGKGRPGWHIECSVMSTKYLGASFDIHGGGKDLVFPHHENELAQAESATGVEPFVRYWIHTGFLTVEGEKMSKSLGNFVTLRDALGMWQPEVLRLWLAGTHYKSPIDYSEVGLAQAARNLERIRNALANADHAIAKGAGADFAAGNVLRGAVKARMQVFYEAMDDDFNTPIAIAELLGLVGDLNRAVQAGAAVETVEEARTALLQLAAVFGLTLEAPAADGGESLTKPLLDLLLEAREAARKRKDFESADRIRDRLTELGFVIEDTPTGPKWRHK